jgi:dTDP-L-rhamnose 4-epimerase
MKVLVTGGAGFIGSHVVDALCSDGAKVLVVDSLDPGVFRAAPEYLNARAEYCFVDLRHFQPDERFADVEAVVHLAALGGVTRAAREPANVIDANCGGTARLVTAMRGWSKLRRVVHASSFSVYGSNYTYRCPDCGTERDGTRRGEDLQAGRFEVLCGKCGAAARIVPITEHATPNPLETYGSSKYMQELCYRGFAHAPVTILRFSSVYGDRLRLDDGEATIIAKIAGWIRDGVRPRLFEDGRQIRDWVFVGDIVATVQALLRVDSAPSLVNVCTGVPATLAEACATIAAAMGKDCPPDVVGGQRPGDMRHCLGDPAEVSKLLGRRPIPLPEGARLAFSAKG